MKLTVVGYKHSKGNYEGYDYENYVFSCVRPAIEKCGEVGQIVSNIKVKAKYLCELPEIGAEVEPYYDSYGNCVRLNV